MTRLVYLSELGTTFAGLSGKTKADFGRGNASYVTFLEVVNSTRLRGESLGRVRVEPSEGQNRVLRGDLLFNGSSETPEEVALSAVVDFDPLPETYLNSFCFGFRLFPDAPVDSIYLAYFFRSPAGRELVSSLAQGATRYNIAKTKLLKVELHLPELRRQREVVEMLSDADALAGALSRKVAKQEDVVQGMMRQLLTGQTRLPGFSEVWEKVLLGDHVSYAKTIALSRAQVDHDSAVRYLHYGDIHTKRGVRLDAAQEPMPRARAALLGNAEMLDVGDLVFADASEDSDGVGKSVEVASVPPEGVVAGLHTIAARFNKDVLADGFKAYLQFIPEFRRALLRLAAGTKVLATTRSYISSIELALPSVEEQRAIAEVLRDADAEIQLLRARLSKAQALKQGMIQELMPSRTRLPTEEAAA